MRVSSLSCWAGLCTLVLSAAACGDDDGNGTPDAAQPDAAQPDGGGGTVFEISPGPEAQTQAQTALIEAQPGDTVLFKAGTYAFDRGLSLDVAGVTIRGEGMDQTVLSFAGQTQGAQGILATADDFVIEDLAVEDAPGDGIKAEGATGVTMRRVRVEWTGGPSEDNGAYGLYPVQCTNVLIEDSVVKGASDAGIYVGQSENIVVRNNTAEQNVAGIEIENSNNADVYGNTATGNTGGLLIFNLPGLQVKNGSGTRVYDNKILDNNTDNFAPEGNIVATVPRGTGMLLMASHRVEIFENEIARNQTANLSIVSYVATGEPIEDPDYNPYDDTIYIHDNTFTGGGDMPDTPPGSLGEAVLVALSTLPVEERPDTFPDIVFFGFVPPDKAAEDDPGRFLPEFNLCIQGNGDADFVNVDAPREFANLSLDLTPHDCAHPALPAVTLPQ